MARRQNMIKQTVLALGALVLGAAVPAAHGELNVAVADMTAIIQAHPRTESNRGILRKQLEGFEAEQKAMMEEFAAKRDKYLAARKAVQDPVIGPAVREEREAAVADLRNQLQRMEQDMSEKILERRRDLEEQKLRMHKLVEDAVRDIVRDVAEKRGLDLVLDRSAVSVSGSDMVVHFKDALDITADISRRVAREAAE
jgi:Skp family chaperone for outer membrane proteins